MLGSVLVMAKAPVPGVAKTRLAAAVGDHAAADLAAAALLDTLDAAGSAYPAGRRILALTGDLAAACRSAQLRALASRWQVVPQAGADFAVRIADGHRRAHRLAGGPVVQIGMDTPQADPSVLRDLAALAHATGQPVLGPAEDGGWWVLVTTSPHQAEPVARVPMSRPDTGHLTATALSAAGHPPLLGPTLADVDVAADADSVAALAPGSRFAEAWRSLRAAAPRRDRDDVGELR
jgi:glycosyltransferase A (GT-A) superfamily protein (DUF2064 family)